jgi:hypothetical protein
MSSRYRSTTGAMSSRELSSTTVARQCLVGSVWLQRDFKVMSRHAAMSRTGITMSMSSGAGNLASFGARSEVSVADRKFGGAGNEVGQRC